MTSQVSAHSQDRSPIIEAKKASKLLPSGVTDVRRAFINLTLDVYPGQRTAIFSENSYSSRTLLECLSGVTQLDRGEIIHHGSVSWPVGTNQAFDKKLSGYTNALFAAEIYSPAGCVSDDLRLIQELAGVDDHTFHQPLAAWHSSARKSLELAVSLAFEFDVLAVSRTDVWNHRAVHPAAVRLRSIFESRIEGRSLLIAANDQPQLAIDYCDEAIVIIDGNVCYRGDPEICHCLVQEEAQRQKADRRRRVNQRISRLVSGTSAVNKPADENNEPETTDAIDETTGVAQP